MYVVTPNGNSTVINVSSGGYLYVAFGNLKRKVPAFAETSKLLELASRLNAIKGISIPEDAIDRYPTISLSVLADQKQQQKFLDVMEWLHTEVNGGRPSDPT